MHITSFITSLDPLLGTGPKLRVSLIPWIRSENRPIIPLLGTGPKLRVSFIQALWAVNCTSFLSTTSDKESDWFEVVNSYQPIISAITRNLRFRYNSAICLMITRNLRFRYYLSLGSLSRNTRTKISKAYRYFRIKRELLAIILDKRDTLLKHYHCLSTTTIAIHCCYTTTWPFIASLMVIIHMQFMSLALVFNNTKTH